MLTEWGQESGQLRDTYMFVILYLSSFSRKNVQVRHGASPRFVAWVHSWPTNRVVVAVSSKSTGLRAICLDVFLDDPKFPRLAVRRARTSQASCLYRSVLRELTFRSSSSNSRRTSSSFTPVKSNIVADVEAWRFLLYDRIPRHHLKPALYPGVANTTS